MAAIPVPVLKLVDELDEYQLATLAGRCLACIEVTIPTGFYFTKELDTDALRAIERIVKLALKERNSGVF